MSVDDLGASLGLAALLSDGAGIGEKWTWPMLPILVGVIGLVAQPITAQRSSSGR